MTPAENRIALIAKGEELPMCTQYPITFLDEEGKSVTIYQQPEKMKLINGLPVPSDAANYLKKHHKEHYKSFMQQLKVLKRFQKQNNY